jgi:hypothetical protein
MLFHRPRLGQSRGYQRSALIATSAALAVTGLAGTAGAATHAPASDHGCATSSVENCVFITGSGLYVAEVEGVTTVESGSAYVESCISGPSLPRRCSGFQLKYAGQSASVIWAPGANVAAGNYCAAASRENSNGSVTGLGTVCAPVHA